MIIYMAQNKCCDRCFKCILFNYFVIFVAYGTVRIMVIFIFVLLFYNFFWQMILYVNVHNAVLFRFKCFEKLS